MVISGLLVALGFAIIHVGSTHFQLKKISVNQFTSFVGGISLSYVFFHLIPTLIAYESHIAEDLHVSSSNAYNIIFGSVLLGIVVFYFLEQAMRNKKQAIGKGEAEASMGFFWAHIASYFVYNFLIGILLSDHRFETTVTAVIYLVTIGVHFWTNDWVLRHHFQKQFDRVGCRFLCLAAILGWVVGTLFHIDHTTIALLEAFVTGGMILNAIKDELPACKGNGILSFCSGVVLYAGLLLTI